MFFARLKAWIIKGIFTGIGTLIVALIAHHYFGIKSPISISVSLPSFREDPAQEHARRAAEAKRQQDLQLTAIRHKQEQARAEEEAHRRRLEVERAAAEVEAMQRRRQDEIEAAARQRRAAAEAETYNRAQRIKAWRDANGGCDPPLRRQCMTVGSSGGGPRQVLGCTCVR
jgi:hypothetical protein